jgi:UTP--glucose-1-phosphate uridylyltransferase
LDPEFRLELRSERNAVPPVVKLSDDYKLVDQFEPLVRHGVPSLLHCKSLTIEGKMEFDPGVEIAGDVKFIARGDETKRVRAGTYHDREIVL